MIKFANDYLNRQIVIMLHNNINNIVKDDLNQVNSVSISKMNYNTQRMEYSLNELTILPNLQNLIIYDSLINIDDINLLNNLNKIESITFNHCYFLENVKVIILKKLKNVSFNECHINFDNIDFNTLVSIESISITNPSFYKQIDLKKFNDLKFLMRLDLENCVPLNLNQLVHNENLEVISLLGSDVDNIDFINRMPKLKKVFIDKRIYTELLMENPSVDIYSDKTSETFSKEI